MGEVQLAFGLPHAFNRVECGVGYEYTARVRKPHVFARQNQQTARDKARVFAADEHFCKPVHRRIGVATPYAFYECGNCVVVLVLVGVVAHAPLLCENFDVGNADFAVSAHCKGDCLEGVEGAAQVAVANVGNAFEGVGVGCYGHLAESARFVGQSAVEHLHDIVGRKRLEFEKMAARQKRRVDVKTGVLGRRADEPYVAVLDVWQKKVLLRLVEAVDFVDEKNRALAAVVARHRQNVAKLRNVREHRVYLDEPRFRFAGDYIGESGLSAPRRPVENQRAERVRRHKARQQTTFAQNVRVPDDLRKRTRAHAHRKRRGNRRGFFARSRLAVAERQVYGVVGHLLFAKRIFTEQD